MSTIILISPPIVYTDLTTENPDRGHWDGVKWTKSHADDSIGVQIEFKSAGVWNLVPDIDLPGNSAGFFDNTSDFCTVDLSSLNPTTYDTLRIKALFIRGSGKASSDPALKMWSLGNTEDNITGVSEDERYLDFALNKIEPNQFTNITKIQYQIAYKANVSIKVFDIMGRVVSTPVKGIKVPGNYSFNWRGTDKNGYLLPTVVYFLQMKSDNYEKTSKMIIVR